MGIASSSERAAHAVGAFLEPVVDKIGISQGDAHVLARLAADNKLTIGVFHEEFGFKRSTLTNIIDRLEGRGLIRRQINRDDRRSFLIELTSPGRRAATQVATALDGLEREVTARISSRDLVGFWATIEALNDAAGRSAAQSK